MTQPTSAPWTCRHAGACAGLVLCLLGHEVFAGTPAPVELSPIVPRYKKEQILLASSALAERNYLISQALERGNGEILIALKRGDAHASEKTAHLELIAFDPLREKVVERRLVHGQENIVDHSLEMVTMPNGDLVIYSGRLVSGAIPHRRTGIWQFRSTDGGKTWQDEGRLMPINGLGYGYVFEGCRVDRSCYVLAMTFPELEGGLRAVHALRSEDNGRTWSHVRNLSDAFGGLPINESSFVREGDRFVITTRGYDDVQRLHLTDDAFCELKQTKLTENYRSIKRYIGRPRLFKAGGRVYLMGRNWSRDVEHRGSEMAELKGEAQLQGGVRPRTLTGQQYALFRIDPEMLEVETHYILDNAEGLPVTDAYYGDQFFRETGGKRWFNVVVYKGVDGANPSVVRFEFDWKEIR
jgi:hypothetical protein